MAVGTFSRGSAARSRTGATNSSLDDFENVDAEEGSAGRGDAWSDGSPHGAPLNKQGADMGSQSKSLLQQGLGAENSEQGKQAGGGNRTRIISLEG